MRTLRSQFIVVIQESVLGFVAQCQIGRGSCSGSCGRGSRLDASGMWIILSFIQVLTIGDTITCPIGSDNMDSKVWWHGQAAPDELADLLQARKVVGINNDVSDQVGSDSIVDRSAIELDLMFDEL
jgi:hypothetical protein